MITGTAARLVGTPVVNFQIHTGPVIEPEEYLQQADTTITLCWKLLHYGNYSTVEESLPHTRLAQLATLAPYQGTAASLATQAKIMRIVLSIRSNERDACNTHCMEAVRFAELSHNSADRALALNWQGNALVNFFHQPQRAISILRDALSYTEENALLQSAIYSDLAIAHASDPQDHYETKARDMIEQAHAAMPDHPEANSLYPCVAMGKSELLQFEGKMYLALYQHRPNGEYAHHAYDAFEQAISAISMNPHYQCLLLLRKADVARILGDLSGFLDCLIDAILIAIQLEHRRDFRKIQEVMGRIPDNWQKEPTVQKLQNELTHASRYMERKWQGKSED
jgi:hypothetical protein